MLLIDDIGAGALVDLARFGLPHEPTVSESIKAGADIVLFSGDKLIGGSQAGIVVGRKELIARLRKHPLMRAVRADKTCLMLLERTLHLFRDPARLTLLHPVFRMMATPMSVLRKRAEALVEALHADVPRATAGIAESPTYLGSGSLPTEALPGLAVTVSIPGLSADELSGRLRVDEACVFGRIEKGFVHLDTRTITDEQVTIIAAALKRVAQ